MERYIVWISKNGQLWPHLYFDKPLDPKGNPVWEQHNVVRVHLVKREHFGYSFSKLQLIYTAYN